jgi:HK97 family phage portal protein
MPVTINYTTDGKVAAPVTVDNAMKIATVYACVRIISEDCGTFPIHVKQRTKDDKRITLYDHPVARLLRQPNPFMNGVDFRCALIASLELTGNAYAHISKRDKHGYPERIDLLNPRNVTPLKGEEGVYYAIGDVSVVPARDIVHLKGYAPDGITGLSPIDLVSDTFDNAVNTTKFSKNLYKNDLRSAGVFTIEGELSPEAYSRLENQLTRRWNSLSKSAQPLILEGGTKVSTVTITPENAQFVATKLQTIDEIAAIFRVPPHKVGDWTRGTYSNNTQANLEYSTDCIRPLLVKLEEELNNKLFLDKEHGEIYVDINYKGLLRTDLVKQMEIYNKMFNIGVYSANDIRKMEDLEPYEGGDKYYVPVNLAVNDDKNNINNNE